MKKFLVIFLCFLFIFFFLLVSGCNNDNIILDFNYCNRYDKEMKELLSFELRTNLEDGALVKLFIDGMDYHLKEILEVKEGKLKGNYYVPVGRTEVKVIFHTEIEGQPQWVIDKYGEQGEKIQGREKDEFPWRGYKVKTGTLTRIEAIFILN
ncbi:MAG: hypothetical protein GX869_07510 [Candidatus Cloacimonetes bacterium]|nr:hypothetical protein [Candidatus Cloacimonadota bacterium]